MTKTVLNIKEWQQALQNEIIYLKSMAVTNIELRVADYYLMMVRLVIISILLFH